MSPDNKEIALVHLGQNIPQRIINLGNWEFVAFVHGTLDKPDITKSILMLVKNSVDNGLRLVMIKVDPWKRIDRT